jgi:hypothetical protein
MNQITTSLDAISVPVERIAVGKKYECWMDLLFIYRINRYISAPALKKIAFAYRRPLPGHYVR